MKRKFFMDSLVQIMKKFKSIPTQMANKFTSSWDIPLNYIYNAHVLTYRCFG